VRALPHTATHSRSPAAISGGKGAKGSQGELKGLLADAGYQPVSGSGLLALLRGMS
jgi:hypothetical protein